ncbi:MAG: hypothetical protein V1650_00245 [Candidatus Omnitrophota bacterium]
MQERIDKIIRTVYKKWKADYAHLDSAHPDEELLVCFLENKLLNEESEQIKLHLLSCEICARKVALDLSLGDIAGKQVSQELLGKVKELVAAGNLKALEIFLKIKDKALEVLSTTGDILVGQEFVPAPLLRSRNIRDFKDEISILKDFDNIRIEAKIENKGNRAFSLIVAAKEKSTQKLIKDLRITLIKEDLELESYSADAGKVTFDNVLLGKYTVEISSVDCKVASILLDIKI